MGGFSPVVVRLARGWAATRSFAPPLRHFTFFCDLLVITVRRGEWGACGPARPLLHPMRDGSSARGWAPRRPRRSFAAQIIQPKVGSAQINKRRGRIAEEKGTTTAVASSEAIASEGATTTAARRPTSTSTIVVAAAATQKQNVAGRLLLLRHRRLPPFALCLRQRPPLRLVRRAPVKSIRLSIASDRGCERGVRDLPNTDPTASSAGRRSGPAAYTPLRGRGSTAAANAAAVAVDRLLRCLKDDEGGGRVASVRRGANRCRSNVRRVVEVAMLVAMVRVVVVHSSRIVVLLLVER